MRLVVVGETNPGSRTPQRVKALRALGHQVEVVPTTPDGWTYETPPSLAERVRYRLRLPGDRAGANARLLDSAENAEVVILDNARTIRPRTLAALKARKPSLRLLWYSEDDMMNPIHRSRWIERSLRLFDLWVTTKSFNAAPREMPSLGVRRVLFVDNAFDPDDHAPIDLEPEDRERWGAAVSFVGTFERARADGIAALTAAGIEVRVWGNGWRGFSRARVEHRPVYGDDYRRVVAASAVNLCFLRHANRDLQTCRSVEIPAMGGFMLHEGNDEIAGLFAPDAEAAYFHSEADLIAQCRRWLSDPAGRQRVALAGRKKALGRHSHRDCWRRILDVAMEDA